MRYFVFVDTPYYPYVEDVIEAASLEEARIAAAEAVVLRPGDNTTIYLVPEEHVVAVRAEGPRRPPSAYERLLKARWNDNAQFYAGGFTAQGPETSSRA